MNAIIEYLIIRGQFHGSDAVDVFLQLIEQVIPASNDTTLILIVNQVQFIGTPNICHLK